MLRENTLRHATLGEREREREGESRRLFPPPDPPSLGKNPPHCSFGALGTRLRNDSLLSNSCWQETLLHDPVFKLSKLRSFRLNSCYCNPDLLHRPLFNGACHGSFCDGSVSFVSVTLYMTQLQPGMCWEIPLFSETPNPPRRRGRGTEPSESPLPTQNRLWVMRPT